MLRHALLRCAASGLMSVLLIGLGRAHAAAEIPRLVFASRAGAAAGQIPGLGPQGRSLTPGGTLLVRERGGAVRPLLPEGSLFDVADPSVSWDGQQIVFAAMAGPADPWRIWIVGADGTGLRRLTHDDRDVDLQSAGFDRQRWGRYDDLDPCWLPDGRICFASTRWPQRAQRAELPVTNLFVMSLDGRPSRITAERNGGEEPSIDPRTGRVIYTRWWFNRFLPSNETALGVTLDRARAVPIDTIDVWTAATIMPDGDGIRLAGGDARSHATLMAYQPIVLRDGSLVGVMAEERSLLPEPGRTSLVRYEGGIGPMERLAGPGTSIPGSVASPLALPDGRLLFSRTTDGLDFDLWTMQPNGTRLERVLERRGTAELDAAVLERRPLPPVAVIQFPDAPGALPATAVAQVQDREVNTFRFDCLNVFTNAPVDAAIPDAPPVAQGLRIRFYSVLARPAADGGDSLVLVREEPVQPSGAVHVDEMVADTPTFEQLVDAEGRVLRSARGPAHVPGYNFARLGAGTKCVGCHTGHSVIPPALNYVKATWFNVSTSAAVTASSAASAAQQVVDRRARGPAADVGWVAEGHEGEWVQLNWNRTLEVSAVVLYALAAESSAGTSLRVRETEVSFLRDGREVKRLTVRRNLSSRGTRVECEPVWVDAIRVTPTRLSGLVGRRRAAGLAEIETIGRLVELPATPGD